jgi:hypothetical protein
VAAAKREALRQDEKKSRSKLDREGIERLLCFDRHDSSMLISAPSVVDFFCCFQHQRHNPYPFSTVRLSLFGDM